MHYQCMCFCAYAGTVFFFFFLFLLIWTHFSKLVIFKTERNIKIKKFQVQSVVYFYRYTFGVMHCFWDQWLRVNLQLPLSLLKLFTAGLISFFLFFFSWPATLLFLFIPLNDSVAHTAVHSCTLKIRQIHL